MISSLAKKSAPQKQAGRPRHAARSGAAPELKAQSNSSVPLYTGDEPALRLSQSAEAHAATKPPPGLPVDPPDDPSEREADRVAERVMRAPEPASERACACGGGGCAECGKQQPGAEPGRLQTKGAESGDSGEVAAAPPVVNEALSAPGRALDPATRAFMEPRFGQDFSRVRVHADGLAADSAGAVEARAYTVGSEIVMGSGEYAPATAEGKRLLAHELAHVLQQRGPGASVKRRVQRSPRALPSRVGASNFLLTGGGSQLEARTTSFPATYSPSGDVSAVVGEGMTLRGLARMLVPVYRRAATAAGAAAAPTEDELALAILDYDRTALAPPAMSGFRAGMRLALPVELDPTPGPVSHTRNDWLLDPDNVRTHAAAVTSAQAPLVDQAAAAAAAAPVAAGVTTFTAAVPNVAAQGHALRVRVLANPFEGAPLASMVLAAMSAGDRFDAAMAFMAGVTNSHVTMLESLAPGFALLQTLRAALTAPPGGLPALRETLRVTRVRMLPQDPAIAGLSPEFLSAGPPSGNPDRPDTIFFRRGRSSLDASEAAKIPALRTAHPTAVTLVGSTSEEEESTLAAARMRTVETALRGNSGVADTMRVAATSALGGRPSVGSMAYAEMRSVRVDPAPPAFEPDCSAVPRTSEPCAPGHAAVETRFIAAQARALDIIDHARTRLGPGRDAGRDAAIRRRFGAASRSLMLTRLGMLRRTIVASLGSHECGTTCDAACNTGAVAYSGGPGATPLMVICENILSNDLEYGASVIIHESCHATQGMLQGNPRASGHPADWAYRWERMSGTITEMSPNPRLSNTSLDNADSYTQFVMDLRDPLLIPAGSQPMEEAPADDFQGTWAATHRTRVRHGLANTQKWLIWATQYLAGAYKAARSGTANATYGIASTHFGGFAAVPGDADRARLAGLQFTLRSVSRRMSMPMLIEHAAAGSPTSFGAESPLLLQVGADATAISNDRRRGELFVRRLVEASPEIDPARHPAYAGLVFDIRDQYEADH